MRALTRGALAAAVAAATWAVPLGIGTAAVASAAGTPTTSVSKTTGLKADGDTVTVSGTGFSGAGAGIYVGLVQDSKFSATDASAWMTTEFIKATDIENGSWSTQVDVVAVSGGSDCLVNTCSIRTVAAHGSPDRSQDTRVPMTFASVAPPTTTVPTTTTTPPPTTTTTVPTTTTTTPPTTTSPTTTTKPPTTTTTTTTTPPTTATVPPTTTTKPPTNPPSGSGPRISASKTSGLNAAGDRVTVRGSGFSTSGPGIYIGVAQTNKYSSTDASVFHDAKFVKPADMPGGSFSLTLDVVGAFPTGDCVANSCAIYTLAAHGSSDRSQDTMTKISFVGTAPPVSQGGGTGGTGTGGTGTGGTGTAPGTGGAVGGGDTTSGTTFSSNSSLSVSLSKASDIDPAGETVTVSGSGFSGAAPGLYVGLVQDNVFSSTDASVWMTTAFLKPDQIAGGSWSLPVDLVAKQGAYDCITNTCSVYTVAAHGSSDRSQDSRTPVSFVGGVAPGTVTPPPAQGAAGAAAAAAADQAGGPSVTLSKAKGLNIDGEEITISGSGFSGAPPGIYVGLIQEDKFSTTDAGAWMTTAFLTPTRISNGSWSTTMQVQAIKGDSDCTKNACSIYTVAAHGSSDRSQDTRTPVSFGDDPNAPNAEAAAAVALTGDEGAAGGPGTDADAEATASSSESSAIRNLADAISDGSAWIVPLLVGAVVGAGFAAGTTLALRRRNPGPGSPGATQ